MGPYTSVADRTGNGQLRALLDQFRAKGVSLILSGHDHYCERGVSHNGIPYIVTAGGGAPLYEIEAANSAPHTVEYNNSVHHYVVIDVDGVELHATAKRMDGEVLDAVTILPPEPLPPAPPPASDESSGCAVGVPTGRPLPFALVLALLLVCRWQRRRT